MPSCEPGSAGRTTGHTVSFPLPPPPTGAVAPPPGRQFPEQVCRRAWRPPWGSLHTRGPGRPVVSASPVRGGLATGRDLVRGRSCEGPVLGRESEPGGSLAAGRRRRRGAGSCGRRAGGQRPSRRVPGVSQGREARVSFPPARLPPCSASPRPRCVAAGPVSSAQQVLAERGQDRVADASWRRREPEECGPALLCSRPGSQSGGAGEPSGREGGLSKRRLHCCRACPGAGSERGVGHLRLVGGGGEPCPSRRLLSQAAPASGHGPRSPVPAARAGATSSRRARRLGPCCSQGACVPGGRSRGLGRFHC